MHTGGNFAHSARGVPAAPWPITGQVQTPTSRSHLGIAQQPVPAADVSEKLFCTLCVEIIRTKSCMKQKAGVCSQSGGMAQATFCTVSSPFGALSLSALILPLTYLTHVPASAFLCSTPVQREWGWVHRQELCWNIARPHEMRPWIVSLPPYMRRAAMNSVVYCQSHGSVNVCQKSSVHNS